MHHPLLRFAGLALLVWATPELQAQQDEPIVQRGARIRATIGSTQRYGLIGRVLEVRGDSILLQHDRHPQPYAVLMSQLTDVQISRGSSSHGAEGLLIGGGLGAVFGAVLGLADGDDSSTDNLFAMDRGEKASLGAATFGVIGGMLGLIAGWGTKTDHWETIPSKRIQPSLTFGARGGKSPGLGITLSFRHQ